MTTGAVFDIVGLPARQRRGGAMSEPGRPNLHQLWDATSANRTRVGVLYVFVPVKLPGRLPGPA